MSQLIRVAGIFHLVLVVANFAAPRWLDYDWGLAGASVIVRQVFRVHAAYIEPGWGPGGPR